MNTYTIILYAAAMIDLGYEFALDGEEVTEVKNGGRKLIITIIYIGLIYLATTH